MEAVALIGVSLVCALICAAIASNKEQNTGNGFIGGCLFGIFGLIYWLAASDKRRERIERERHDQQMDAYTQVLAKKVDAIASESSSAASDSSGQPSFQVCPVCNSSNNIDSRYCCKCGAPLSA